MDSPEQADNVGTGVSLSRPCDYARDKVNSIFTRVEYLDYSDSDTYEVAKYFLGRVISTQEELAKDNALGFCARALTARIWVEDMHAERTTSKTSFSSVRCEDSSMDYANS